MLKQDYNDYLSEISSKKIELDGKTNKEIIDLFIATFEEISIYVKKEFLQKTDKEGAIYYRLPNIKDNFSGQYTTEELLSFSKKIQNILFNFFSEKRLTLFLAELSMIDGLIFESILQQTEGEIEHQYRQEFINRGIYAYETSLRLIGRFLELKRTGESTYFDFIAEHPRFNRVPKCMFLLPPMGPIGDSMRIEDIKYLITSINKKKDILSSRYTGGIFSKIFNLFKV